MSGKNLATVKVEADTDRLISDAAYFLNMPKKDFLDAAARFFIAAQREQIHQAMAEKMRLIDDSDASLLSLLTGLSTERINELGGIDD